MVSIIDFLNQNVIWAYAIIGLIIGFVFLWWVFIIYTKYTKNQKRKAVDWDLIRENVKADKKIKKVKGIEPVIENIKLIKKYEERILDNKGQRVMDKDKFYFEAKPFSYFKKYKWYNFSLRRFREKRMIRKFPAKVVLVRFEMNNGTHREFLVKDDASGFDYNEGRYVFDLETRYWIVDSLIWAYDFHESLSISLKNTLKPNDKLVEIIDDINEQLDKDSKKSIKRVIPINELKETIEQSGVTQVENSINPIVLERVIKSEIIQAILQGSALGRLFRVLLIITIIIVILVALDVVIDFMSSDLPSELGLGGGSDE